MREERLPDKDKITSFPGQNRLSLALGLWGAGWGPWPWVENLKEGGDTNPYSTKTKPENHREEADGQTADGPDTRP